MGAPICVVCDVAELAVDVANLARESGHSVDVRTSDAPIAEILSMDSAVGVLVTTRPLSTRDMLRLSSALPARAIVCAMLDPSAELGMGADLGIVCVDALRPALAASVLAPYAAHEPWFGSTRGLGEADKMRLGLRGARRASGRFARGDGGMLSFAPEQGEALVVGEPRDVAAALDALFHASRGERPSAPRVEGVDRAQVLDVLYGPPRPLSDPASKDAIQQYDVPLPLEELCGSPSRAATEASGIGYPVRVALASPDLRVWEHPDLVASNIDTAARVRDVFRQIMALAKTRAPEARLLGVMVSAHTMPRAELRVVIEPLGDTSAAVACEIAFADPHGAMAQDKVRTILPRSGEGLARALDRLRGSRLLYEDDAERGAVSAALGDTLMRVAAFCLDWKEHVERIELSPIALLVNGDVEVREMCVSVGDAFQRSLAAG